MPESVSEEIISFQLIRLSPPPKGLSQMYIRISLDNVHVHDNDNHDDDTDQQGPLGELEARPPLAHCGRPAQ